MITRRTRSIPWAFSVSLKLQDVIDFQISTDVQQSAVMNMIIVTVARVVGATLQVGILLFLTIQLETGIVMSAIILFSVVSGGQLLLEVMEGRVVRRMPQGKQNYEPEKPLQVFVLGLVIGLVVGGIPFYGVEAGTDPFDKLDSYSIWLIGLSLSAMGISFFRSEGVWRWAIAVGLGFPIAVFLDIIFKPEKYQLPPLTIIFSLIVGLLSAFSGAYIGKLAKRIYIRMTGIR